jgi:predicted enzyme related to lactoylglutathione lyase
MITPTRLSRIVLLVRGNEGVATAVKFYTQTLGIPLRRMTDEWAELQLSNTGNDNDNNSNSGVTLQLQATYNEGQLSTGYTPLLTLEVSNMDETIAACAQAGGMYGTIQEVDDE